jgi:hypothetical protein
MKSASKILIIFIVGSIFAFIFVSSKSPAGYSIFLFSYFWIVPVGFILFLFAMYMMLSEAFRGRAQGNEGKKEGDAKKDI